MKKTHLVLGLSIIVAGASALAVPQTQVDPSKPIRSEIGGDSIRQLHQDFFDALARGDSATVQRLTGSPGQFCFYVDDGDGKTRTISSISELTDWVNEWQTEAEEAGDEEEDAKRSKPFRVVSSKTVADGGNVSVVALMVERHKEGLLGFGDKPEHLAVTSVVQKGGMGTSVRRAGQERPDQPGQRPDEGERKPGAQPEQTPYGRTVDAGNLKILHLHMSVASEDAEKSEEER